MMEATAFAPGHISGFFEPIFQLNDYERSGSRGSGINISLGATSTVTVQQSLSQEITVFLNKKPSAAPVTKLALQQLIGQTPLKITVDCYLDLPTGQGFGMSGAGALSAATALGKLLQLSRQESLKAAHFAEVQLRTGLSDVIASSFGGVEIRREPGLPPWGMIEHIPGKYNLVLCVIGKKMNTKKILTASPNLQHIAAYGRLCTKKILEKPSVENLFTLSQEFTKNTKLADPKVVHAITSANSHGRASMCMLGNSVFAMGDTEDLIKTLAGFGKVYLCTVDEIGARILEK
jgi:pantoate kinase